MAAPTLVAVAFAEGAPNHGSSETTPTAISWQVGDVVVVLVGTEGASSETWSAPTTTGSGLSLTQKQLHPSSSDPGAGCWTAVATAASSGTFSITQPSTGTNNVAIAVYVFRGSAGVGNSAISTGSSRTCSLTPTGTDGSIVWGVFDWAAAAVQSATPTPTSHSTSSPGPQASPDTGLIGGRFTYYIEELDDQTSGSAVSYGIGGTGTGPFTIIAIEAKAGSSGSTPNSGTASGTAAFTKTTATGTALHSGSHTSGTVVFTKTTASGTASHSGSATGTAQFNKTTASGFAPSNSGSASGTLQIAKTTASGTTKHSGTASGTVQFAKTTATGTTAHSGSASGTVVFHGADSGTTSRSGSASGTLHFSATATGTAINNGHAAGTVSFAKTTASGSTKHNGSATGATAFAGNAAGSALHSGANTSGTLHLIGSASGTAGAAPNTGSAGGTLGFAGAASGTTSRSGSAAGFVHFQQDPDGGTGAAANIYLYQPPTYKLPVIYERRRPLGNITVSTVVYRLGGVWHNQIEAWVDNPVVADVDVDSDTGLRCFFNKPMVIPQSVADSGLADLQPADPSWSPGSLTQL